MITTEAGGQATFTVRLDRPPTTDVTIPVSSSDITEGTVSTSSLLFTPVNWNVAQTVTITGVDDVLVDGNIAYTIVLGTAITSDPLYVGLDPIDVSVTNTDNESTKFYVVNDGSTDRTYEYADVGNSIEDYALNSANTAPRGAASTVAGDKVWVVDANRKVFVYNSSGLLLGSWTASNFNSGAQIEGIATDGTDVWILDRKSTKVFKYADAASRTSGSQTAASSFAVARYFSGTPLKDIVTDGVHLWIVADVTTDTVSKYTVAGAYVGDWIITTTGANSPTGITIDPSNVNHFWIVDSGTDRVYQYDGAASRSSGSQSASSSFALASGNTNPQGIADPPPPALMQPDKIAASASSMAGAVDFAVVQLFDDSVRREPSRISEYDRTDSTQAPTRSVPTHRLSELLTQQTKQLAASENRGASAAKRLARSTDDLFSTWNADELELLDM